MLQGLLNLMSSFKKYASMIPSDPIKEMNEYLEKY